MGGRSIACPSCGKELALSQAELRHGQATCVGCWSRLELRQEDAGASPHRAMAILEPRAMLPGPPTARIRERLRPRPALAIAQERGRARLGDLLLAPAALAVLLVALYALFVLQAPAALVLVPFLTIKLAELGARLFGREELTVDDGALVRRPVLGRARRLPVATIARVDVTPATVVVSTRSGQELELVDPRLGHSPATLAWIAGWVRERLSR